MKKMILSSFAALTGLAYLLGYKSETRREIREIHDSRLKYIYYYTVRK